MRSNPRKPVVLDVDAGIDDALALLYAFYCGALEVRAVTTVAGNAPVEMCTRNVLRVLALSGKRVPVAQGCARPLQRQPLHVPQVHGSDGLGDLGDAYYPPLDEGLVDGRHAVDLLIETTRETAGQITLIATGPLTNVATAIRDAPCIMRQLQSLVVMGGAFRVPGNMPPGVAEFNCHADPEAAAAVIGFGLPLIMVGLDVTHQVRLTRERAHRELDPSARRIGRFVLDVTNHYMDFHGSRGGCHGCYLHDPLAVGAAVDPTYVDTEEMHVLVETRGDATAGMTLPYRQAGGNRPYPNAVVCCEVDHERFLGDFLAVISGARRQEGSSDP